MDIRRASLNCHGPHYYPSPAQGDRGDKENKRKQARASGGLTGRADGDVAANCLSRKLGAQRDGAWMAQRALLPSLLRVNG